MEDKLMRLEKEINPLLDDDNPFIHTAADSDGSDDANSSQDGARRQEASSFSDASNMNQYNNNSSSGSVGSKTNNNSGSSTSLPRPTVSPLTISTPSSVSANIMSNQQHTAAPLYEDLGLSSCTDDDDEED